MMSISQIKDSLLAIAEKKQLRGVSVDMAIDLLAQAIYYDDLGRISIINNNNIDTTGSINTLIKYALDNLYSIYRGTCSIVKIKMLFVSDSVSKKKGDRVFSYKNYSGHLLEDLQFNRDNDTLFSGENQRPVDISQIKTVPIIITTDFRSKVRLQKSGGSYYLDSPEESINISDYINLFVKDGSRYKEINYTENASDHLDKIMNVYEKHNGNQIYSDSDTLPLMITSYNYGVRLFPSNLSKKSGYVKMSNVPEGEYFIDYATYSNIVPQEKDFRLFKIPGMKILTTDDLQNIPDSETISSIKIIDIIPPVKPDDINSNLPYKIKSNLFQMQRIRSNFDLMTVFNRYFHNRIASSSYKYDSTGVTIYYVPRPSKSLTSSAIAEFRNRVLYHITDNINIIPATPITLVLNIKVFCHDVVDKELVSNVLLNKLNYRSGKPLYMEELISAVSKVKGVDYPYIIVDNNSNISNSVNNRGDIIVEIPNDKYLSLDISSINIELNESISRSKK